MTEAKPAKRSNNHADDHPPTRPGIKTAIGAAILLIGGLAIYW